MKWLLPERQRPRELAILDHLFVSATGGINQQVQVASLCESRGGLIVAQMIAWDARDGIRKVSTSNGAAGSEYVESELGETYRNTPAHTAARSCNKGGRHGSHCSEEKEKIAT